MIAPVPPARQFQTGQLVVHRRYGYRGVVVDSDDSCRAPDTWYQSNQTRPDRHQPWYHVLVDGSNSMTYAAQTSLAADGSKEPIAHPLLNQFFAAFDGEFYVRNDAPSPDW